MCPATSVRRGRRPPDDGVATVPAGVSSTSGTVLALGLLARLRPVVRLLSCWCVAGVVRSACGSPAFGTAAIPAAATAGRPCGDGDRRLCRRWAEECPRWEADCLDSEGNSATCCGGLMGTSQDALADLPEPDELDEPDDLDPLDDDEPEDETETRKAEDEEGARKRRARNRRGRRRLGRRWPTRFRKSRLPSRFLPPSNRSPASTPAPPPIEPPPAPAPATATDTPCEIAADELPQVGE